MPESGHAENLGAISNRRTHARQPVRSLSYIDLGDGNGGIVLNLSEGGLALQAVTGLIEDQLPRMRFQLSETRNWLETGGRITWTSESRKVAGVEFVNLTDAARKQIREWISLGDSAVGSPTQRADPVEKIETTSAAPDPVLFMPDPVDDRPIGIPTAKERLPSAFKGMQPTTMFPDAPAAPSVQTASASDLRTSWTLNPPQGAIHLREEARPNRRALIVLFGFLAVVSLVVGWTAGRTGLSRIFGGTPNESAADRVETPAQSATARAKTMEIEIDGADDRSRLIPFDGPLPPDTTIQHGIGQRPVGKNTYQVWVLSPPVRGQNPSTSGTEEKENPPVLNGSQESATNVLPSSTESRTVIAAPAPPSPQVSPSPAGVLQRGRLIHRVEPLYPAGALESGVEGTVKLHAVIGEDGSIKTLESVSGPDLLLDPAMNAVRQWRYTPTLLDGKPIQTDQDIFIVFRLPGK